MSIWQMLWNTAATNTYALATSSRNLSPTRTHIHAGGPANTIATIFVNKLPVQSAISQHSEMAFHLSKIIKQ